MPRYAIVEAPSALGHVPEHLGVERAPQVLLGAGLADGLAARRAGRIEAAGEDVAIDQIGDDAVDDRAAVDDADGLGRGDEDAMAARAPAAAGRSV